MAADFILDELEESPGTCWVTFVAKRPVGRGTDSYSLSVELEECTLDEIDALSESGEDDRDLLLRKARNWKGFKVKDGDKLVDAPFERERLEKLLSRMWFVRPLSEAYQARMASVEKRRSRQRGN